MIAESTLRMNSENIAGTSGLTLSYQRSCAFAKIRSAVIVCRVLLSVRGLQIAL
jgi:hypothetical protein